MQNTNSIFSFMNKVTVIIPIYKVEAFIERCATTLLEQTLREVEYIFVDDATPDSSIQVLEDVITRYPERKEQVRIIHHQKNQGLPNARNTGLALATGEYIFHCDSDDYVDSTMLEDLYNEAKKNDIDIVWCDWYLTFANNERYMKQPSLNNPMEALKAMLGGGMKFNVWNKLVRRSLYVDNCIDFPNGNGMGEDMTMMMLFVHAKRISYIPKAYYHYVKTNTNAFSRTYSDIHLRELRYNVSRIENYMRDKLGVNIEKEVAFFKLDVKFPLLLSNNFSLWNEWYPEANKFILQNKYISTRSRWIQWLASKKQFWLIGIYNFLINKIIYGVIYK